MPFDRDRTKSAVALLIDDGVFVGTSSWKYPNGQTKEFANWNLSHIEQKAGCGCGGWEYLGADVLAPSTDRPASTTDSRRSIHFD
jgi:hypothetical protein